MELLSYLRILRRRWYLILTAVVVSAVAALLASQAETPRYQATIQMYVATPAASDAASALSNGSLATTRAKSYAGLASTGPAIVRALQAAGLPLNTPVSAVGSSSESSVAFSIDVQAADPRSALAVARAYGDFFPDYAAAFDGVTPGTPALTTVRIFQPASVGLSPVNDQKTRNLAIGIAFGLLLGLGSALLAELLVTSVRETRELEDLGLPVLGAIPQESRGEKVVVAARPQAPRAEAFRRVRTNVVFAGVETPLTTMLVTSATPNEGRTSVVANLGVAFAESDKSVVLVDADLRKPLLHSFFGLTPKRGLTDVLVGAASLDEVLITLDDNLVLLPSGQVPANPSELLGSSAMGRLVQNLEQHFDVVLFDAPPLLPYTDASVLTFTTSGVLVVARMGQVNRDRIRRALRELRSVNARVVGVIANSAGGDEVYGRGSGLVRRFLGGRRAAPLSTRRKSHSETSVSTADSIDAGERTSENESTATGLNR